ncbi:MAG: methyltransferase domain-containing protein [Planctomycetota bacterium]|jgi:SAM-dependent methyltransferase
MSQALEQAVRERYARSAENVEQDLCCAVHYESCYLDAIPVPVIELDHGCGDPSKWLLPSETVLDLGSGGGKLCYIAAQVVGPQGRVIGVDFNQPMLDVARTHQSEFAANVGFDTVSFRKGRIQDLALDLDALGAYLAEHPVCDAESYLAMTDRAQWLRDNAPLIADESIDVVVSNCVLNLVEPSERGRLFDEMYRVLRRGGRCVVGDIVCDEDVPQHLRADPELWSGCISGAYREDEFLQAFERAGFYGIEIVERGDQPWRTVEGIEFRSLTVRAYKGKEGPCLERNQAVIYRGPWRSVSDDDGHTYYRGERMAVCDKTYRILIRPPYNEQIIGAEPREEIALEEAHPFDFGKDARRHPRQTKGLDYRATTDPTEECCGPQDCC